MQLLLKQITFIVLILLLKENRSSSVDRRRWSRPQPRKPKLLVNFGDLNSRYNKNDDSVFNFLSDITNPPSPADLTSRSDDQINYAYNDYDNIYFDDDFDDVISSTSTTTTTTTTTTTSRPRTLKDYCLTNKGQHAHPTNCHKFLDCWLPVCLLSHLHE